MLIDFSVWFWVLKILIYLIFGFALIAFNIYTAKKYGVKIIKTRKNVVLFLTFLFLGYLFFLRGDYVNIHQDFSAEVDNFDYMCEQMDSKGGMEVGCKIYKSGDVTFRKYSKSQFDNYYRKNIINNMRFKVNEGSNGVKYSYSKPRLHRETSYLNCYTGFYELTVLFESEENVIVVEYLCNNFKWYDYIVVLTKPRIPEGYLLSLLS